MTTELIFRNRIQQLKEESLKLPQVEVPLQHYFSTGVYAREMYVKAGTTITGKIHKDSTVDILLQGVIVVVDDQGIPRKLTAPMVYESKPGISKAGHVLEDVRWVTVHGVDTDTRDIAELESRLVVEDYQQYLEHCKTLQLEEK